MQRSIRNLLLGTLIIGGLALSSCTSMITEEQLSKLQELRREEASLNEKIENINLDIQKLERELKDIEAQAADCDSKKKFVEEKLKQWPNVWGN